MVVLHDKTCKHGEVCSVGDDSTCNYVRGAPKSPRISAMI